MSSNPIPEPIRRQVWDLLRPYRDITILSFPPITLNWVLHRVLGSDKGNPNPGT